MLLWAARRSRRHTPSTWYQNIRNQYQTPRSAIGIGTGRISQYQRGEAASTDARLGGYSYSIAPRQYQKAMSYADSGTGVGRTR
eukprot:975802-Rhodomonas_salina.1